MVNELSWRWEQTHEKESAIICEHVEHWKTTGAGFSTGWGSSGAAFVDGGWAVMIIALKGSANFEISI